MLRDGAGDTGGDWNGIDGGATAEHARFEQLHRRLKRIVKARGALHAQEAAALREAQSTKMWRHYGCSSLVDVEAQDLRDSLRFDFEVAFVLASNRSKGVCPPSPPCGRLWL